MTRFLPLLLLAAGLSGCARAKPDAPPATSAAKTPGSTASASTSAPPPRSAPPAPPPPAFEPPEDPELSAFYQRLESSCQLPPEPMSTAEMVGHATKLEQCALEQGRRSLKQLPAARAERLRVVLGRPDKQHWSPVWHELGISACHVDDDLRWTSGDLRGAGTMRRVTYAACFSGNAVASLYWLEAFARDDVSVMARHLRLQLPAGKHAERLQALLERDAARLAKSAPEVPTPDGACDSCSLGDATFRKMSVELRALRQRASSLASALCQAWPELAGELGGVMSCQDLMRLTLLSHATGSGGHYESLLESGGSGEEPPERQAAPPAKDRDYAAFIEPVYDECERLNQYRDEATPALSACFEGARQRELAALRKSRPAQVAAVEAAWRAFSSELCTLEHAVWGPFAHNSSVFQRKECQVLASARAAYLAHTWAADEAGAFRRHALHRRAWGERVVSGLELARRVVPSAPKLRAAAHKLSAALCDGWPALAQASADCAAELELYFVSQGQSLGMMRSAEDIDEALRRR